MKLYLKECKKIASSILYYLFIAILVLAGHRIFEVTQAEINRANGITPAAVGFERPLLSSHPKRVTILAVRFRKRIQKQ